MTFHTLRATWATRMLDLGVSQTKVMAIGGWKDLDTFNICVRLAAIDVTGATDCLDNTQAKRSSEAEANVDMLK